MSNAERPAIPSLTPTALLAELGLTSSSHSSKFIDQHAVSDLVEVRRRDLGLPFPRRRPRVEDVYYAQEGRLDEVVALVSKPMGDRRGRPRARGAAGARRSRWIK